MYLFSAWERWRSTYTLKKLCDPMVKSTSLVFMLHPSMDGGEDWCKHEWTGSWQPWYFMIFSQVEHRQYHIHTEKKTHSYYLHKPRSLQISKNHPRIFHPPSPKKIEKDPTTFSGGRGRPLLGRSFPKQLSQPPSRHLMVPWGPSRVPKTKGVNPHGDWWLESIV